MKWIGLALVLTAAAGLALWPGAAGAGGFKGRSRAFVRRGQVTSMGRARAVVPKAFVLRHPRLHRTIFPPFAIVDPGLAPASPVFVDPAGPAEGTPPAVPPPPVQPKMIVVKPGPTRDWCWDKTTWSWVPTCS